MLVYLRVESLGGLDQEQSSSGPQGAIPGLEDNDLSPGKPGGVHLQEHNNISSDIIDERIVVSTQRRHKKRHTTKEINQIKVSKHRR